MLPILIAMLVIVAVAALVVTYVAFPHRGEEVPGASWLGDAMAKGVEALPTLEEDEAMDPTRGASRGSGAGPDPHAH